MAAVPGFVPGLLTLSIHGNGSSDASSTAIRHAASVYLKNFVEKHWETYDDSVASLICDADKATIRAAIVNAVVEASEQIRVQYLTIVKRLVRSDFPKVWTNLLEQLVTLLQSGDVKKISAGLGCFLEVVSWRGHSQSEVNDVIQSQIFPILLQLANQFLSHIEEPEAQGILKTILKTYFTAIQFKFSSWLMSGDAFLSWMQVSMAVIQSPVPASILSLDKEDAAESRYWKMKKWSFHIQNKIVGRWGNNKLDTYANSDSPEFAKAYMNSLAIPVLQVFLTQAHSYAEGNNPLPDRIVCLICDFFEKSIRHKKTWAVFHEQMMWVVQSFIFPRLCWSEADAELWQDDPHEFIRSRLDPFDDIYSPAAAGVNFIVDLISARKNDSFFPILGFVNGVFTQAQSSPNDLKMQSQKDGALYLIGSLATQLLKSKKTRDQMESFVSSFVIPELTSPLPHLRLRACWALQQFDDLDYTSEAHALNALSGILSCMGDQEFPVRVAACTALGGVLESSTVQKALPPYLPRIVETILNLANEIELDSLSYILEDIVAQFAEDLSPYAAQLCAQLRDTLMRSIEAYNPESQNEDGESVGLFDDTDKMMAVLGMMGTINTLVDSMSGKPETLAQLENILLPMLYTIFQRQVMDVYEEAFALLEGLTYGQKHISPALWQLVDLLYTVFKNSGSSYIAEMATSLDNYISYGHSFLIANPQVLAAFVDMLKICMTDADYVESDWVHACNLMESLMLHCRGAIDQYIPIFLQLTISKLADVPCEGGKTEPGVHAISHRVYHLEVILNALYYNANFTIHELEKIGASAIFLSKWLEIHDKFTRVHDKKLIIVAISALLQAGIPLDQMPAVWQQSWPSILATYLDAMNTLPKAIEERQKLKEAAERDDHTGEGAPDVSDYEEESDEEYDPKNDDDFEQYGEDDWDDDSDWEDADELEEEVFFETPLDNIDVATIVTGAVKGVAASQPATFHHLTQSLNQAQQATLQQIMQHQ